MKKAINDGMWAWAKDKLEHGWSQSAVARALYVHKSTIGREIKVRGGINVIELKAPAELFLEDDECGTEKQKTEELLDEP